MASVASALTRRDGQVQAARVRMVIACVVSLVASTAASEPELPLSTEVLPSGEATPDSRVVVGDGYLFQIPKDFKRVDLPGGTPAYTGTVKGFGGPAPLTFWAQREPFRGNLEKLTTRETEAATKAGATDVKPSPVMAFVGTEVKQRYATRLTIKTAARMELRTVVVHGGVAYIHHCETPNVPNAWANVGSDCITRGTTFHIAPAPLAARKPADGPAPPRTKGIVFMGSKVEGKARHRADVRPWVEKSVAPYLKPCLKGQRDMTKWLVTFDVAKDGKGGRAKVVGGEPEAPADAATASCIAKVINAARLDAVASDTVQVSAVLMVNSNAD